MQLANTAQNPKFVKIGEKTPVGFIRPGSASVYKTSCVVSGFKNGRNATLVASFARTGKINR